MNKTFDAIIVGAGQAGPPLAGRLTKAGWSVAAVERKFFGGTCVNNGCTPTKAMIASAHAAHLARRGGDFGFRIGGGVDVDLAAVRARKDAIVIEHRNGVESSLRGMQGCTVFTGAARFVSPTEMRVDDDVRGDVIAAKKIFLNVGARPNRPADMKGTDTVPYLTSTTILDLPVLPTHLLVVGGSYIGLEFAQMFRRFGCEVTVVEMGPRLVSHNDEDASMTMREILEGEGIQVRTGAKCIELVRRGAEVGVALTCDDPPNEITGSHVLLAVGRVPNTDDLDLAAAGITPDRKGYIPVDEELRTSVPGIWAMGDCNGRGAFTHTSYNDFEIVAANLLDNDPRRVSDRVPVSAMFTDPPLAQVGMTEKEVRATGRPALVGMRPMTRVNRAVEKGESQGFMKVLVDAESRLILGATILGTGGDEAIHCIVTNMMAKQPGSLIQRSMHIHPTVAELLPTILGELKPLDEPAQKSH